MYRKVKMKKQKIYNILQCFFMATIACIAVIFVIKYSFEIKAVQNNDNTETTKTSSTTPIETTSKTASTGASTETPVDETTGEDDDVIVDIKELPLEKRTYTVNNVVYYNKDLMKPCEYYNSAIVYNDPRYLDIAYPQIVIDYLVAVGHYNSVADYVEGLYSGYRSIFNENFFIKNTLVDTTILNDDELKDMNSFFKSVLATEFPVEYAVLMKTTCTIQTFDNCSDNSLKSESEDEYFISYFYDNKWYIDYLYSDYYFFN